MKANLPILLMLAGAVAIAGWIAALQGAKAAADAEKTRTAAVSTPDSSGKTAPARGVPAPEGVESRPGEPLLNEAIERLGRIASVETKIRQRVELFDRELIGAGSYAQQGAGITARLRLEMRIRSADQSTDLLQVCDGETLWTLNAADGLRTLRRVDLDRVAEAIKSAGAGQGGGAKTERRMATGEATTKSESISARGTTYARLGSIGLGGLPWMVEGLRRTCEFGVARPERLGDLDVWAIDGSWRPAKLAPLMTGDEQKRLAEGGAIDPAKLPAHLPDRVTIYLGRDDLFPYRIDYRRTVAEGAKKNASHVANDDQAKMIMSLEFYEVRFGRQIDPQLFKYKPGQGAIDDTERYIKRVVGDGGAN